MRLSLPKCCLSSFVQRPSARSRILPLLLASRPKLPAPRDSTTRYIMTTTTNGAAAESPLEGLPLSTPPAPGQRIVHDGVAYDTVREGLAHILVPPHTQTAVDPKAGGGGGGGGKKGKKNPAAAAAAADSTGKTEDDGSAIRPQSVFYNPIQQFNRDLSVLAIRAFGEDWLCRKRVKTERHRERRNRKVGKKRKLEEPRDGSAVVQEQDGVKRVKSNELAVPPTSDNMEVDEEEDSADGGVRLDTKDVGTESPNEKRLEEQHGAGLKESEPGADTSNGEPRKKDQPWFRILDALSATGLRALRYAKEIPFVTAVVANDMNPNAIKSMEMNIEHNGLATKIRPNLGDAMGHMYSVAFPAPGSHGPQHVNHRYDVVDLDPYGTAAPFIDPALQALNDGGLLCVTCTDSGVFASTGYSEKTYALYGGMPVKGPYMHEGGLRLIINSVATAAARHGLAIEPLLSLSIDYYVRIFIRVRKSPFEVKFLAGKTMLVYACDAGCGAWTTQTLARNVRQTGKGGHLWFKHSIAQAPTADHLCAHCGSKTHLSGPMWAGPLHNQAFVEKILHDVQHADVAVYETIPRIEGMLNTALEELSVQAAATQYTAEAGGKAETDDAAATAATAAASATPSASASAAAAAPAPAAEMIPQVPPELVDHHPFFFNPSALSKVLHCVAPSDAAIKGALRHAGYQAARSHCQPGSVKTNAPWTVIWQVMREWVRQKAPIKDGALREGQAGWKIMQAAREEDRRPIQEDASAGPAAEDARDDSPAIITEQVEARPQQQPPDDSAATANGSPRLRVIFDEALGRDAPGKRLVRYQQNPRENWGPMTRAKGGQ